MIRLLAFESLLILLLDRNPAQILLSHPLRHGFRHLLSTTIISDTGRRWPHPRLFLLLDLRQATPLDNETPL